MSVPSVQTLEHEATLLMNGMMQKATDFTIGSGSGVDAFPG